MGYYSDVTIAIKKEEYAKHFLTDSMPVMLRETSPTKGWEYVYWELASIKWYSNYEDVQQVDSFLSQMPDESYGMIRIGENDDDIEYRGSPSDAGIYVERALSVDMV